MTRMNDLPSANTRPASNWSAIWVLPLVALLIGGWLAWRAYSETGIQVELIFTSGEGIEAGKTEVVYKGMPVGRVTRLKLDQSEAQRGVIATLEMNKDVEYQLRSGTRFWLVKPSVSLAGITGLETLVSGNYIAVSPGTGDPAYSFQALPQAPPLSDSEPGLHLTLKAERLGSLNRDSPVFYKQIQVGRVKGYALAQDQSAVEVKVFIEPAYAHLVRKHTRFWNASGISVDATFSGLKVRSESIASIVAGGISFATPEQRKDSPPTDPSKPFRLYEDFDAAQAGIKVVVKLSDFEGLQAGRTPVIYNGIQVGTLKGLKVDHDLKSATAELTLDPQAEDYLLEDTQFWVVKPSISLAGISGLEALVKGNYIATRPGKLGGKSSREFVALKKAPPLDLGADGLHLVLFSDNLGSIDVGSPILYRQVQVGTVQSFQLSRDRQRVVLGVHVNPEYSGLVNRSTRFWNVSGITLKGSLSGVEVKSESLKTLMAGGIAFETEDFKAPVEPGPIQHFSLYPDREAALQPGEPVRIRVERGDGLSVGTSIRFRGLEIGKVERVELTRDLQAVMLYGRITTAAQQVLRPGSRFWVVKPELGLARTANLGTLVTGQYLEVQPAARGDARQTEFVAEPAPETQADEAGLRLVLSSARRGSLKSGAPVTYREVQVGKVTGYELGATADRVLIHILIEPRYVGLVRSGSRFWNSSGFGFDASLFEGLKLRTESLETLVAGGVAFATPETAGNPARQGQTFALFDEAQEQWLQWAPKIALPK
jgi:paraquat-inducible protein B